MKKISFIFSLLIISLFSSNLKAQNISGWYIGGNLGASWLVAEGNDFFSSQKNYFSFIGNAGYMLRAELGYDFNSVYGVRGFLGTTNNRWPDARLKNAPVKEFSSYSVTADFMLNLSNLISGYSPDRKIDFSAFAGAGIVNRSKMTVGGKSWTGLLGRGGLQGGYKINNRLNLNLLMELNMVGDKYNDYVGDFPLDLMPTMSVGISYKL